MENCMKLLITFSGGESSALMAILLTTKYKHMFSEIVTVFCNTSQENQETLDFVHKVSELHNIKTVWLEAVTHKGERKACTHKVVSYESASMNGDVFEGVIKKYGIPNMAYPHCTRALKLEPITSYLKSIGWSEGSYVRAIGIRSDEPRRLKKNKGVIYPLAHIERITKSDVNSFWSEQEFRLNLTGYQGNCKTCWKKSLRKLMTIMDESPESFNFFERMERDHAQANTTDNFKRSFFRGNLTTKDMRVINARQEHDQADDDSIIYHNKQVELDLDGGCQELCDEV